MLGEGLIRAIRGAHPAGRACARSKGLSCPFYRTKGSHQGLAAQPNKRKSSAMQKTFSVMRGEGLIRAILGAHPAGRPCARSKGLSCPFYRTKGSHQGLAAQPNKRKSSAMQKTFSVMRGEGLIRAILGAHPAGRPCARSKGLSCPFYRTKGSHQGLAAQPNKRKSSAMQKTFSVMRGEGLIRAILGAHPAGRACARSKGLSCPFYRTKGSHQGLAAQPNKRKSPAMRGFFFYGGERGIRTLDTLLTYTPLAGARLQPLGQLSNKPDCVRSQWPLVSP